jgi:flagellar hook-associated protein 1 FlgK
VRRVADQLAISRLLDSSGELARLKQLSTLADRVDSLFSDTATNVSGVWSNFFDTVSGLSSNASGTADRQNVLDSAGTLASRFKQLNESLNSLNGEVNNGLIAGRHGSEPAGGRDRAAQRRHRQQRQQRGARPA